MISHRVPSSPVIKRYSANWLTSSRRLSRAVHPALCKSATRFSLTGLTYGVILIVAISVWFCSWERPREGKTFGMRKRGYSIRCLCWRRICVQPFICAYSVNIRDVSLRFPGAEWLFASIFRLRHLHPAARSSDGGQAQQPELQFCSWYQRCLSALCVKRDSAKPYILGAEHRHLSPYCSAPRCGSSILPANLATNHPDVWHHGAVRSRVPAASLHSMDRLHLPRRCR